MMLMHVHPFFGRSRDNINVADVFSSDLYSGNGATTTITNGINFSGEGGLAWFKARSQPSSGNGQHHIYDTVRGSSSGTSRRLNSGDSTSPASNESYCSFLGNGASITQVSAFTNANTSGQTYIAWSFRRAEKFFDIVTYTGTGSSRTIAHNLGAVPGMIIAKRTDTTADWQVYHRGVAADAETDYLVLNSTAAAVDSNTLWNDTAPTSAAFSLGTSTTVNASGGTYVAYLFAHDISATGIIQCGSYTGNGSSTGPIVNLGWEPQWGVIKRSDSTGDWWIYDNARSTSNPRTNKLLANSSAAEDVSGEDLDFTSTGFQPKTTAAGINASGGTYVYAFIRKEGV